MLLLIKNKPVKLLQVKHLNTSNVTVNHRIMNHRLIQILDLNTSNVTVNRNLGIDVKAIDYVFKYI